MSTTLVAFHLQTPRRVNSVKLLGSWDNFSKPYSLKKDTGLGSCHWRGCHLFTDIICDGEVVEPGAKRDGPLMQGGCYWYFYQLDDEVEYHNPKQPSTTTCPFLPGQEVNVLEIPNDLSSQSRKGHRYENSLAPSTSFTLDPEDRYRTPKPLKSPTKSHKPKGTVVKKSSKDEMGGCTLQPSGGTPAPSTSTRHEDSKHEQTEDLNDDLQPTAPPTRSQSIKQSTSKTLRRWRSVVSRLPSRKANKQRMSAEPPPPLPSPSAIEKAKATGRSLSSHSRVSNVAAWKQTISNPSSVSEERDDTLIKTMKEFPTPPGGNSEASSPTRPQYILDDAQDGVMKNGDYQAPKSQMKQEAFNNTLDTDDTTKKDPTTENKRFEKEIENKEADGLDHGDAICHSPSASVHETNEMHHTTSIASSRGTSGVFSSVVDSRTSDTGQCTPWRFSQPLTPTFSDFGDFKFETTPASPGQQVEDGEYQNDYLDHGGFHGYNLPENDHASALTIRNLETAYSKSSDGEMSQFEPRHRDEIIRAWKAGAGLDQHQQSTQQELANDLGYLGEMIA